MQLARACDALEPDQVARVLGAGQVTETEAGPGAGTITGCSYQVDGGRIVAVAREADAAIGGR